MQDFDYTCPKCGNSECDVGDFWAGGGLLGKIATVRSKHFSTLTCTRCQYTEIYRTKPSSLPKLLDLFTNG
jgi:predicted nucleic-acid-binding Zn-ribbon protein